MSSARIQLVDDAYLGCERNGGKPGRGSENKQPFVAAVATDETLERRTFAVIEPVRGFDNVSLTDCGKNGALRRMQRCSATGWAASDVSSNWIMRVPCGKPSGRAATEG